MANFRYTLIRAYVVSSCLQCSVSLVLTGGGVHDPNPDDYGRLDDRFNDVVDHEEWSCGENERCVEEESDPTIIIPGLVARNETEPFWSCNEYPPWKSPDRKPDQSVALIFRGQQFRWGKKINGIPITWVAQRHAWESHRKYVVEPFEREGFKVDVFSASYPISAKADVSFDDAFSRNLRNSSQTFAGGSQAKNAWDALLAAAMYARRNNVAYRYVVLTRHDSIILQDWTGRMKSDNKVVVPFYYLRDPKCQSLVPAPDFLFTFPGKFLGCFMNTIGYSHRSAHAVWKNEFTLLGLMERSTRTNQPSLGRNDYQVMVDIAGSSDNAECANPILNSTGRYARKTCKPCERGAESWGICPTLDHPGLSRKCPAL